MTHYSKYFYGNEISSYGLANGYVDYATLSKAFDAVLNNSILEATAEIGYWEIVSGFISNYEEIERLENTLEYLDEDSDEAAEIRKHIEELEEKEDNLPEVYQLYIVDNNGAEILKEINEIVYYNDALNMHLWGVTHWGTAWNYVLTNIKLELA